jgi:hypothetical protein
MHPSTSRCVNYSHVGFWLPSQGLEVSELEASRVRNAELRRVTGKQKLLLVVDLDHTMLNSARFSEVPLEERTYLSTAYRGPNPNSNNGAHVGMESNHGASAICICIQCLVVDESSEVGRQFVLIHFILRFMGENSWIR